MQKKLADVFMDRQRDEREKWCIAEGISSVALAQYVWGPKEFGRSVNVWNNFQGSAVEKMMCPSEGFPGEHPIPISDAFEESSFVILLIHLCT